MTNRLILVRKILWSVVVLVETLIVIIPMITIPLVIVSLIIVLVMVSLKISLVIVLKILVRILLEISLVLVTLIVETMSVTREMLTLIEIPLV